MKLVTHTEALTKKMSYEEAVRMIAEAGFDAVDCSFFDMEDAGSVWNRPDWREHAISLRAYAESLGVHFQQAHAPFPTTRGQEDYDTQAFQKILRAMEIAALLGAENIVVHPVTHMYYAKYREALFQKSVALYRELIPYCQKFGIRVCTENMWDRDAYKVIRDSLLARPEEFVAILEALDSPWIGGCLDLGHTALVGQDPATVVRCMGKKHLQCLHVHDVDGLHDSHTMPFLAKLDWNSITQALGQVDYQGALTFEAGEYIAKLPQELWADALKLLERVGRYLIAQIDKNRPV